MSTPIMPTVGRHRLLAGGAVIVVLGTCLLGGAAVATGDVGAAAPVTLAPAGVSAPSAAAASSAAAAAVPSAPASAVTSGSAPPTTASSSVPTTPTAAVPPPPLRTPTSLAAAPAPADPTTLPELGWRDSGDAVAQLQARLNQLGFRTADSPGDFGDDTWSAVLAFQKFEGLDRTAEVSSEVWAHLYQPTGWLPPSQSATTPKVEVDLERQVVFLLNLEHPGQVVILNTSTGGGYSYTDKDGSSDYAYTPEGDFNVYRTYDGVEVAPLGTLYRPLYFYGGWALHGSPSVPAYPASHGCVRLSNDDVDWLWDRAPTNLAVTVRATMNPDTLAAEANQAFMDSYDSVPAAVPA